jgi:hypothetical protein
VSGGGSKKGERRGGRKAGTQNKVTVEIRAVAMRYVPAAIKELARLSTKAENEQTRVTAIGLILDRAYGKARQPVDQVLDVSKLTDEQLSAIIVALGGAHPALGDLASRSGEAQTLN